MRGSRLQEPGRNISPSRADRKSWPAPTPRNPAPPAASATHSVGQRACQNIPGLAWTNPKCGKRAPLPTRQWGWEVPSDGAGPGVSALGAEQRPPCRPLTPPPSSGQHLAPTSSRPQAPGPTACSLGPCHSVPRWAEVRVHLLLSGLSYPSTQSTRPSASSRMRPLKPSSTHPDRPRAP